MTFKTHSTTVVLFGLFVLGFCLWTVATANPQDLAKSAKATASESYQNFTPDKAVDGDGNTRWSAIPGQKRDVWFQLEWPHPVRIAEVVVFQHEAYAGELDIRIWETEKKDWITLRHCGRPESRLSRVVLNRFEAVETTRLRLADITGGPSFGEIAVYQKPYSSYSPSVELASDLKGNFIGMVTDPWGAAPIDGARVDIAGQAFGREWRRSALSGERGLVSLPMPLQLQGTFEVRIKLPGQNESQPANPASWEAVRFQYGLTPCGKESSRLSLNGRWRFSPDPPADFFRPDFDDGTWAEIKVPAHWEMEGFRSEEGEGGYRKRFTPPPGEGRVKLRFEGVYSGAHVWVNGQLVAHHEGGFTPFEADITDALRPGENLLALRVCERTVTSLKLDKGSIYADFPLAGIMRAVSLFRVPSVHIGGLILEVDFDEDYCDAALKVKTTVLNFTDSAVDDGRLVYRLIDPSGAPVPADFPFLTVSAAGGERWEEAAVLPVESPLKWDAEHPALYTLIAELRQDGTRLQSVEQRFGFRQVEVLGTEIRINGHPVKLKGTCHHDTHPLMGRAVTPELTRRDLEMIKGANLNALRTSHYSPIPELLDYADELGLYLEDEAPFCWAHTNDNLNLTPRIIQLTAELVARDRNHPCVVLWSLCNESQLHEGFRLSQAWTRAEDPARPTTTGGFVKEISTQHNPIAISRMDEYESLEQPLLFDESFCIFQGIWRDAGEIWVDPGIRDYYAQPLAGIYDRFMRSKVTQGSMIWCWVDDIFCVPGRGLEYGRGTTKVHFLEHEYRLRGRGLVGDAPWGVVDGWRREKPEYWIIKKLHSPVRIREDILEWPTADGALRIPVFNQYDFTNLKELKMRWILDGEKGIVTADIPPQTEGQLLILPAGSPEPGSVLELEFFDASDRLVDAFRLPLGKDLPVLPDIPNETAPLRLLHEDVLAGRSTVVTGKDFAMGFDCGGGYMDFGGGFLRRSVAFGESFLMGLPTIHLLPAGSPESPMPNRLDWKKEKMDIRTAGENVEVSFEGSYPDFKGSYRLLITPGREIEVDAAFEYTGPGMYVRETGLRLFLPRDCDRLLWDRRAEWNVYPGDHIGRPHGTARAFAAHDGELPPTWPWSQDNTPMGSNDFRSTKRNINYAAVRYPEGPGLLILADGKKHLRAMVEGDRITLHISDWYGGTHSGLWEWTHNYGQGKRIETGDVIRTRLRLRFVDRAVMDALWKN